MFKNNPEYDDEKHIEEHKESKGLMHLKLQPTQNQKPSSRFLKNLEGTKDSYSDSEEPVDQRRVRPNAAINK